MEILLIVLIKTILVFIAGNIIVAAFGLSLAFTFWVAFWVTIALAICGIV